MVARRRRAGLVTIAIWIGAGTLIYGALQVWVDLRLCKIASPA